MRRSEPGDNAPQVSLAGQNSIFGSIGSNRWPISTNKSFIPLSSNAGDVMRLNGMGDVQPVWMGLDTVVMQSYAYDYCSPLAAVIDRLAQADTNGRVEFVDDNGATIKNINKVPAKLRVKKLLNKPNPLQTWHEFNNEQVVLCKKHGYCPVFAIGPKGADKTLTSYLINLNPLWVTPVANVNFDLFSDDEKNHNPISNWRLSIYGQNYYIDSEDILLIKDGLTCKTEPGRLGLPKSKVEGLDYFISNICAAMEADNVILKKKGPLGVFSYDQKPDIAGQTPMSVDDKEELQQSLNRYGLTWGQLQYVISNVPVKWNPMSFNIEELKTKDTIRMGIDGICDRFDYPAELMSGKNATYENRSSAERFLYQNNVIPFSLRRMAQYCVFFDIEGLVLDYDHLKVLQEDILHAGQAAEALSNSLVTDWEAGMISMAEYRIGKGLDVLPGQETIFYPDYIKANPLLADQGKTPKASTSLKPVKSGKAA